MDPVSDKLDSTPTPPTDIVQKSAVFYGAAGLIALGIMWFGHRNLPGVFLLPTESKETLRWLASGCLAAFVLLVLSRFFEDFFVSFQELKSSIIDILGPVSIPGALTLALMSSLGEELLFRGALQPYAGLTATSIIFGLLHMGPSPFSAWSLWATLSGLLLGWLFDATSSLWPPILAHFIVNASSLLSIRKAWAELSSLKDQDKDPEAPSSSPSTSQDDR